MNQHDNPNHHECLLCKQPMSSWLDIPGDWQKPESSNVFEAFWCENDKFGKLLPTPSPEILADHYNISNYYTRTSRLGRKKLAFSIVHRAMAKLFVGLDSGITNSTEFIARELHKKPSRILEIGCGHGDKIIPLSENGHECVGIEPDPNSRSRQAGFAFKVYDGTAENPPAELEGQKFDCVVISHVLEHCVDPIAALHAAKAFLNDGGFIYIEVPNIECADFKFTKLAWPHLDVPRHLNFFSEKSLRAVLELSNFDVPRIEYAHYYRQMHPEWVRFNKPIVDFYRERGAIKYSPKDTGWLYYWGVIGAMGFAPKKFKYDSLIAVSRKKQGA